ncbi:MAG: tripartite tricarboxylate transporter substrate-binding protein [Desulfobacterales bacterium]|jgi:tripartite-type tricarboxylate transporter receptor subunit TctC
MKKTLYFLILALLAAFLAVPASHGADFSGKTIQWIIPFKVGGGSDVWSRLYAPFLQKYMPGNPIVAVKNMPGGGSIIGGNHFHTRAKPDGLTVFGSSGSTTFPYLLENPKVRYDFSKYHIVFATPVGGVCYINPDLGVKSVKNLKDVEKPLAYASQGATSLDIIPLLAFDMLGLDVKAVFGYKGRGPGRVAFEQGEVNIDYQTTPAYIKNVRPLIELGKAIPLMTWGTLDDDGNIVRDPVEPDIPCMPEAYEIMYGKKPGGPAFNAWKAFFIAGFGVQKAMWLPEKTNPDIVEAYREAAAKVIADPEFQTIVDKSLGGYKQLAGEKARQAFDQVLNVPAQDRKWLINWIETKYDIKVK